MWTGCEPQPQSLVYKLKNKKKECCLGMFSVFIAKLMFLSVFSDCFEDWSEAQKITSALLEGRSYENLIDFDNHLDDLRNDWTNPVINKSVLDLC